MITAMINATVKSNHLGDFLELASQLTRESRKRKGCVSYIFNQRKDKPTEFVLYEQWECQADLDLHIQALVDQYGPPKPGEMLPEKLLNMYEKAEPIFYEAIE